MHDADHGQPVAGQGQDPTDRHVQLFVCCDLVDRSWLAARDGPRPDDRSRWIGDDVDVGVSRCGTAHDVPEDRDGSRPFRTRESAQRNERRGVHRRVRREGSGDALRHDPGVGSEEADGAIGLGQETVVDGSEQQGHGEYEGGGQHAEDDPAYSPLHVAKRDPQHVGAFTGTRDRTSIAVAVGITTTMNARVASAGMRTSTSPDTPAAPKTQPPSESAAITPPCTG